MRTCIVERGGFSYEDALGGEAKGIRSHDSPSCLPFFLGSLRGGNFYIIFSRNDYRVSRMFAHAFSRFSCVFRSPDGSSMMDLMMQLLIISASHGSCSSDLFHHSFNDG